MFQPIRNAYNSLPERIRTGSGRRAAAIFLTLLIEVVMVLLLLTLSPSIVEHKENSLAVFSISADPDKPASAEPSAPSEKQSQTPEQQQQQQPEEPATQPPENGQTPPQTPPPLPWISLSREQMATADIGAKRPAPPTATRKTMGPPNTGTPGDTPRAEGQGPNGEPLYAASWYREPYEDELRGYLSTAQGPGWGLIACRTVADYRVEDCVALSEYPQGSGITRAVLAAAWQFRVRPPRVGGRSKVGEWVRIRIDYDVRRK